MSNYMASMTPEERRAYRARAMFEFLVRQGAWAGCPNWEGLNPKVRDTFTDMVALYAEPFEASADEEGD
jgi:hypothetical protein